MTTFTGLVPVFTVRELDRSIDFYVEHLDFELDFAYGTPGVYAGLFKDAVALHLIDESSPNASQPTGSGNLSILTDEVDDLHQRLVAVEIEMLEPPGDRDYGLRDFSCRDRDGNRLTFSTLLEG